MQKTSMSPHIAYFEIPKSLVTIEKTTSHVGVDSRHITTCDTIDDRRYGVKRVADEMSHEIEKTLK